ncbi:MAG: GWxTD domain-containing protein, partial [Terriglobia bacterium]
MKNPLKFIGVLAILFLFILSVPSKRFMAEDENGIGSSSVPEEAFDPYFQNWLEQDVAYIITNGERIGFKRLATDEERELFITMFWFRRDPTRDTLENEFRDEHYRRMVYANEKFTTDVPGWKTDRGRIYILLGPPDQIESKPTVGSVPEVWRYHRVPVSPPDKEVTVEFLDQSRDGNYRLITDVAMESLLNRVKESYITNEPGCKASDHSILCLDVSIVKPPRIRHKELEVALGVKVRYDLLPFKYHLAFTKVTDATVLTFISIQIKNRDMTYRERFGKMVGTVNLFGRIKDPEESVGRIREAFEAEIKSEIPKPFFNEMSEGASYYQTAVPLKAGRYKLELALR